MANLMPTTKSVSELVDLFESGSIVVPEIQRDVVWKADKVKALVDSISKEFPCGSLILWEPREKDRSIVRSLVRPERLENNQGDLPKYFLLDGQQRLTALSSVLLKRELLKDLLVEIEDDMPYIYTNLKKFPNEMEATDTQSGYNFPWVLFNKLFDGTLSDDPGYSKLDNEKKETIRKYVQKFRDYQFPIQIISGQKYETVAEIFTRVNSLGTQLTGAEIYLAKIVPHWTGITREFREYRKEVKKNNYDLDLTFLIKAITAIECKVPQIKKLAEKIHKDQLSKAHLNKTWKKVKNSTNKIINVLQKQLCLDKSKYITSKNALVPLVYYIVTEQKGIAIRNIKKFFIFSQLSEHYGSAADTTLRKDFKILTEALPRHGLSELVENVIYESRQKYRGLKIKSEEFERLPSRSVLLLLMYMLMRKNNATDWGGDPRLALNEIEPKDTQLHHIFPFNLMLNDKHVFKHAFKGYEDRGYSLADYREDVNSMANLTFLSQIKNGSIGDVAPSQYLLNETTPEIRKAHFIPEDPKLWKTENFMDFLDARSYLMAEAMTRFIKRL